TVAWLDEPGTIPSKPRNGCVIISKKMSAAPYRDATLLKERDREPLAKSVSDEEGAWVFTTWTSSRTAWVR
ncbi:MAG: hypothetical protein QP777_09950, partial [Bifidobacterium breve]